MTIRYSTAQLFTRIESGESTTLYFAAIPGIPVEFALDSGTVQLLDQSSGKTTRDSGVTLVTGFKPGVDSFIDLAARDGRKTRLVVLTSQEADNAWKVQLSDGDRAGDHLLITTQDFFADSEAEPGRIWLRSRGTPQFAFTITPPPAIPLQASLPLTQTESTAQAASFITMGVKRKPDLQYTQVQPAGNAPPVLLGPAPSWRSKGVAHAPAEGAFKQSARWRLTLPSEPLDGLSELYLEVGYRGDVARLYSRNSLLTDNFYNGQPWSIGLSRFINTENNSFDLSILPLRKDAPVYFELSGQLEFAPGAQVDSLDDLRLIPEYQLILTGNACHEDKHDPTPGPTSGCKGMKTP
jgi:beta-galactosidase